MIGRLLIVVGLALSGCAGSAGFDRLTLDELRKRAGEAPGDGAVQRRLALAEMFSHEGDPARVQAQIDRAIILDGSNPRLRLAAGIRADSYGLPDAALEHYVAALLGAGAASNPFAQHAAEVAAYAVAGVEGGTPGFNEHVRPVFERLLRDGGLAAPSRHAVGNMLITLAFRRGDRAAAQAVAAQLGCITEWRVAGPFGPRALLGFDRSHGVKPAAALDDQYDLGPSRGVRPTRDLGGRGCSVSLGGGALAAGGTSYVQTPLQVEPGGRQLLRIETPNSVEAFIDGASVARLDRRRHFHDRSLYIPLDLPAGDHLLTLKITTRHPNPAIAVSLSPRSDDDLRAVRLPFRDGVEDGFARYLRAATALVRGNVVGARETLRGVSTARRVAPMLRVQRAFLALHDPLVPVDVRNDEARRLLLAALQDDPHLWNPTVQIATMAANAGRVIEAINALRKSRQLWPKVPAIGLTLLELLRAKGWHAEGDQIVKALRQQVPDACGPMQEELNMLRRRGREDGANAVVDTIMACDAQSNARYALLLRQRRWQEAGVELARMAALDPPQGRFGWLLAELELAKNQEDDDRAQRVLSELRSEYPRSTTGALEQIDRALAGGDRNAARGLLERAIEAEPATMAPLWRLSPFLGAEHVMTPFRMDGHKAIADYEAAGQTYEGPQVLVFDYMAVRLFEDGSSMELVHTIQKAQSHESVDAMAEVQVPDNARVLKLQTIKADGRRLEADAIAGKPTISLPSVAEGDYVEFEYMAHKGPSDGFPQGYLGDRFYFRSFEIPFDYSHMVVALPKDMPVALDPRGEAPETDERLEGDLRVLSWKVTGSQPLVQEPASVAGREFIPSVRLGVRATWEAFVEGIRDVLADRSMHDPGIERLVRKIVGEAAPDDHRLRAKRIHGWVLEHIENTNDMFSQAALMIRAKSGNRARVLDYMLTLAGVPSELALVRSKAADATEAEMADGDTYEHLVVVAGRPGAQVWLHGVERWAPFGYMPALLQGQPALMLEAGSARGRVPAGGPHDNLHRMELAVEMRTDGSARFDVIETLAGSGAIAWRAQLESTPDAELESRFEDDYVARLVSGATLASLEIVGREDADRPLSLVYSFDVDVLGRKVAAGWALPSLLGNRLAANFARVAERTTTELIGSPVDNEVVFRFKFPAEARRPGRPDPASLRGPADSKFTLDSRWEGDTLVVERFLQVPIMRVKPADYPGFVDFCRKVDAVEARELVYGTTGHM